MYHLYDRTTRRLVSSSSLPITAIPDGMDVCATNKKGIWNPDILDFDPFPAAKKIKREEFYRRVGIARLHKIITASKTDDLISAFVTFVSGVDVIDLVSPDLMAAMDYLKANGVLTDAEAQEIING